MVPKVVVIEDFWEDSITLWRIRDQISSSGNKEAELVPIDGKIGNFCGEDIIFDLADSPSGIHTTMNININKK